MSKSLSFAAISGSLRDGSHSTSIANTLQDLVPEGVTVTVQNIADIPLYNHDLRENDDTTGPAPVRELAEKLAAVDALVIVSPEYNRGMPGVLKNTLDWLSKEPQKPLAKPVLLITQSPGGAGGLVAQYDLRRVLGVSGSEFLPGFEVAVNGSGTKIKDGKLVEEKARDFIAKELARLTEAAAKA